MECKTFLQSNYVPEYNEANVDCKSNENLKLLRNYVHIPDRKVPPRALAVLPVALQIKNGIISPRRPLPSHVRFGPVQGVTSVITKVEANSLVNQCLTTEHPVFLLRRDGDFVTSIDISDKDKSNWLGLLPIGNDETANVWLYEEDDELYGYTLKSIPARTSLAIGYSKEYAENHGFPLEPFLLNISKAKIEDISTSSRRWWCHECQRTMATAALLQLHMDVNHKDEKPITRRRYRCKQCTKPFSRLFTLKRHIARYCFKKTEKCKEQTLDNQATMTHLPDTPTNQSQNTEDSRIPSDESFNNYTNGIDFNNLFDTDRIPNLDISGGSASEVDFNPYGVFNRDESSLTNMLDFSKFQHENDTLRPNEAVKNKTPHAVTNLIPCPSCNQTIEREDKRNHVRACPGLKYNCECGRTFTNNQKLANHMNSEHNSDGVAKKIAKKPTETKYKCEDCQINFKRRGMLVNHLWRVHNTVSTAVPLERRVRHYPCVACPKIYRTAAKRDRHVRTHHPDAETSRKQSIEGGLIACRPAVCFACPRQYATRAKLLQHVRANHPNMAPPLEKNLKAHKVLSSTGQLDE